MNSLQARGVDEARRVAEDHPSIAGNRRNCPPAAVGHRLGTVADHLAAFEQPADEWMLLEFLHQVLRIDARVGIIESDNESHGDDIVLRSVNPATAVFLL